MKIKQFALSALILLAIAVVTSPVSASEPYFCTTEMPNALRYLPGPPARSDMRFAYDSAQYQWGKRMRPNCGNCSPMPQPLPARHATARR